MSSALLLSIDGGGTSTTAWLGDTEGRVLGRGKAGPSNRKSVGDDAAFGAIQGAVRSAFRDAGCEPEAIDSACFGIAGCDHPADQERILDWAVASRIARRLVVINDAELLLAAGTPEAIGIAVIAGTGSIAVGRSPSGRFARAGGWGHLFGDEGSAYGVALAGLRLVARRADGRQATRRRLHGTGMSADDLDALSARFMLAYRVQQAAELVTAVYGEPFDRARLAALATIVLECADDDPEVLTEILEPAGRDLAECVLAVARSLDWREPVLPLALGGSFLVATRSVRETLVRSVEACGGFHVEVALVEEPAAGGLLLARKALREGTDSRDIPSRVRIAW